MNKPRVRLLLCGVVLGMSTAQALEIFPAYRRAADAAGVPPALLQAVCAQESNHRIRPGVFRPWPWTLNIAGQGFYFKTRDEAHQRGLKALKAGQHPDWGLCQINSRWHGAKLHNTWQALDPRHNLAVAAAYLRECYQRQGDWLKAAGCYHSQTERHARPYRRAVAARLKRWGHSIR